MSEFYARTVMILACALSLAGFMACPSPPNPMPVGPGGGVDAARPPTTCFMASAHAESVCPGAGANVQHECPGASAWDSGYIPCVMAATGCFNCDSVANQASSTHRTTKESK